MAVVRTASLVILLAAAQAAAAMPHDKAVRAAFLRSHPCPATNKTRGACPGWIVDHRVALCVGGADVVENMQWQSVADAKAKDKWECRPGWQAHQQRAEPS